MIRKGGEPTGLQSWGDDGQNRESGGTEAEQAPYAAGTDGQAAPADQDD